MIEMSRPGMFGKGKSVCMCVTVDHDENGNINLSEEVALSITATPQERKTTKQMPMCAAVFPEMRTKPLSFFNNYSTNDTN